MPSHTLFRSYDSNKPSPIVDKFSLPDNAILFTYSSEYETDNYLETTTKYGTLESAYARISYGRNGFATYGTPFIRCTSANTNWTFEGVVNAPNTNLSLMQTGEFAGLPVYGTQLAQYQEKDVGLDIDQRYSGRHGYTVGSTADFSSPSRANADIPTILGLAPGDAATTVSTDRYNHKSQPHEGHLHTVYGDNFANKLTKYKFGELVSPTEGIWDTGGLNLIGVGLLKKDFNIPTSTGKPVTSIPKGILVLGNDISLDTDITSFSENYAMLDAEHDLTAGTTPNKGGRSASSTSFAGVPLYMVYKAESFGVMSPPVGTNTINFSVTSNTSGMHDHRIKTSSIAKSDKTGLSGDKLGPAGDHTHDVSYKSDIVLKSKWLNGWITLKNETPLANGMIIAYCPPAASVTSTTTDNDLLPPNWHFCDGNNGTPDLRDYMVAVNMNTSGMSLYNTVVNTNNQLSIASLTVGPNSGEIEMSFNDGVKIIKIKTHTHVIGVEGGPTTKGTPIPFKGSHAGDPSRWHTHVVEPNETFTTTTQNSAGTNVSATFNSITPNSTFNYNPSSVTLAFIMLNKAIP